MAMFYSGDLLLVQSQLMTLLYVFLHFACPALIEYCGGGDVYKYILFILFNFLHRENFLNTCHHVWPLEYDPPLPKPPGGAGGEGVPDKQISW
jgi:hypothetical protein